MYDFKILHDKAVNIQKKINQWKHNFSVKHQSTLACPHKEGYVIVTLLLIPKAKAEVKPTTETKTVTETRTVDEAPF